jgi:hypothetical protein
MTRADCSPERISEDVIVYSRDCESGLDYALALYLGRSDDCSIIIEERLLRWLRFDEKRRSLDELLKLESIDWAPYNTLGAELKKLFAFRDAVAHSSPDHGDRFRRFRRRRARNEVIEISRETLAEQLDRGMQCQSAVFGLPDYLLREQRNWPTTDPLHPD